MLGNVNCVGLSFKGYTDVNESKKASNSKSVTSSQEETKSQSENSEMRRNLRKVNRQIRMVEGLCRRKSELDSKADVSLQLKQLKDLYNYKFELERKLSSGMPKSAGNFTPGAVA